MSKAQQRAVVGAGLVVVVLVIMILVISPGPKPVRPDTAPPAVATTSTQPAPGTPEANAPFEPPAEAEQAMRVFLDGYLDYLYGRGDATSIKSVSGKLRKELGRRPPRVSPAQKARTPRIVAIRARKPTPERVQLVATINAGETSSYPIGALLVKRNGRWIVTEILNDE